METTCNRCHQTVQDENCYCPSCGLPQFVYSAESAAGQGQTERWNDAVRDAASIDWKPALRAAFMLAIPAGILCAALWRAGAGLIGLLLMAVTGAWVVALYIRSQRPAWITVGAGTRIGLVTGILGSWTAAAAAGVGLYAMRFWFHSGKIVDDFNAAMNQQMSQQLIQQWTSAGVDAQTVARAKALMLSPEWSAGLVLFTIWCVITALLVFAVAGGALGARFLARSRRPEI